MDTELSDLELVAAVEQMESNLWCSGDDELTDMELLRFVEMMEESFAADKGRTARRNVVSAARSGTEPTAARPHLIKFINHLQRTAIKCRRMWSWQIKVGNLLVFYCAMLSIRGICYGPCVCLCMSVTSRCLQRSSSL